ncbi:hypothetical protein GCM10017624_39080 [Azotobacter vinelandii]|nr:hypothetical protein GCM10017624_39080 [Azotobacter vinelandii]
MLDLRPHLRLGFLDPAFDAIQDTALAMPLVGAAASRDLPDDFPSGMLRTFLDTDIGRIETDQVFLAMQHLVDLGDIRHVGRRAHHVMHQARLGIDADMRLQSGKAGVLPLLPPLRTVHESHPSYGSSLPAAG